MSVVIVWRMGWWVDERRVGLMDLKKGQTDE